MSRLTERIENFNKAFDIYLQAVNAYNNDKSNVLTHLALVQSFEIVFELGWKVLKDFLATKDIQVYTPRDVIKEAFNVNILPQAQIWIDMAQDRNSSSHEYNMDKVNLMLERISKVYCEELVRFQDDLRNLI